VRQASLLLRVGVFTLLLPCSILAWMPYYWIAGTGRVRSHWPPIAADALAVALVALGAGTYVACAWRFATEGNGTPAPWDPPRTLVAGGLYRWVRNPMYVGIPIALIGEGWWWKSSAMLLYAALVWVAFHLRVVLYEEPKLREMFGDAFDAYCGRVKRWGVI
jgi:protein-S-isoprenylcysteine O-methyltransferase Ste14